jgi:hypothetical protein
MVRQPGGTSPEAPASKLSLIIRLLPELELLLEELDEVVELDEEVELEELLELDDELDVLEEDDELLVEDDEPLLDELVGATPVVPPPQAASRETKALITVTRAGAAKLSVLEII